MTIPSQDYISYICSLYGSHYDDRIENTSPPTAGDTPRIPGDDWMPGTTANHKSLIAFQRELAEQGIKLSTSKIKKILITGGLWTTSTSREIQELFNRYTSSSTISTEDAESWGTVEKDGGKGLSEADAIRRIASERGISAVTVSVNLPYSTVVYNLENRSSNAKRCQRYKERKIARQASVEAKRAEAVAALKTATDEEWQLRLWRCVVEFEEAEFCTSGRGSRPGVSFEYRVSRTADQSGGGRRYSGVSVDGYGNELWVTTAPGTANEQNLKKSISRSTVELGYRKAVEMNGSVPGPKALGIPGDGSYVFSLLREFRVIEKQGEA